MKDLSTSYLGLQLKNPLIVGSCGLTHEIKKIKEFEQYGAGAVVLKSLFEEQIAAQQSENLNDYTSDYPGADDYIREYTRGTEVDDYLDLIEQTKREVDIPVIASINCVEASDWVSFAKSMENSGADAIEINVSLLPSDPRITSNENEAIYTDILSAVAENTSLPLALKMSPYSASLTGLVQKLSWKDSISGFVLFNRYYTPDININTMTVTSASVFSTPAEHTTSLRWMALLSGMIEKDLAASTGIHDSKALIKQLLAGATVVQVVSTVYKNGPKVLQDIITGLENWMSEKNFNAVSDFRGKLNYQNIENPAIYERTQFMKFFSGIS